MGVGDRELISHRDESYSIRNIVNDTVKALHSERWWLHVY